jgi:microcystin-dependent protein
MTGYTPGKGLPFPNDYNDPADVPADMEALAQAVDAAMVAQDATVANAAPVGSMIMYGGNTAPEGWHLCNGTAHGSAALQAVIGSPNTPDLRSRFIVGAGTDYAVGATGGLDAVTLTSAQSGVPAHSHTITVNNGNATHSHSVTGSTSNGGNHSHPSPSGYAFLLTNAGGWPAGSNSGGGVQRPSGYFGYTEAAGTHTHTVTGSAATQNAAHAHSASAANNAAANAAQSHENRPPYYALTYIIRKG